MYIIFPPKFINNISLLNRIRSRLVTFFISFLFVAFQLSRMIFKQIPFKCFILNKYMCVSVLSLAGMIYPCPGPYVRSIVYAVVCVQVIVYAVDWWWVYASGFSFFFFFLFPPHACWCIKSHKIIIAWQIVAGGQHRHSVQNPYIHNYYLFICIRESILYTRLCSAEPNSECGLFKNV